MNLDKKLIHGLIFIKKFCKMGRYVLSYAQNNITNIMNTPTEEFTRHFNPTVYEDTTGPRVTLLSPNGISFIPVDQFVWLAEKAKSGDLDSIIIEIKILELEMSKRSQHESNKTEH